MSKDVFNAVEAAHFLGCSTPRVYWMYHMGYLNAIRLRPYLFARDDLERNKRMYPLRKNVRHQYSWL